MNTRDLLKRVETDWDACSLPADSEYVRNEIQDMAIQLDNERRLTGDATVKTLFKEMVLVPGNRKRAIISIMLMICQQMTGVNAIVGLLPRSLSPHTSIKSLFR